MSTSKGYLKDARGVDINAGDVVIYGFGVSRSVAMAEGVVLGKHDDHKACLPPCLDAVSQTKTGLVRVRVVRRSYAQGEKPVVAIMADRMVVLKQHDGMRPVLPPSPLPTQDEELYGKLTSTVERYMGDIERLSSGGELDRHEIQRGYNEPPYEPDDQERIAYWLNNYREWEAEARKQLEECCARLGKEMPV
jgi:hypothetical protein